MRSMPPLACPKSRNAEGPSCWAMAVRALTSALAAQLCQHLPCLPLKDDLMMGTYNVLICLCLFW